MHQERVRSVRCRNEWISIWWRLHEHDLLWSAHVMCPPGPLAPWPPGDGFVSPECGLRVIRGPPVPVRLPGPVLGRGKRLRLRVTAAPSPERGCSQCPESGSEPPDTASVMWSPNVWSLKIHNISSYWKELKVWRAGYQDVSYPPKVIWVLVSKLKIELS